MRPEDRHLICLDIDNTLMTFGMRDADGNYVPGVIDPDLAAAIRTLHQAGHEVVLSTGRAVESTLDAIEALRIQPSWGVAANGAVTLKRDPLATRAYRRHRVEAFDATELLTRIRTHLLSARYGVETVDGEFLYTERIPSGTIAVRQREVAFEDMLGLQVSRVLVMSEDHGLDQFFEISDALGLQHVSYSVGLTTWFDIAPGGVSKASALEVIRDHLDIHPSNVFAAGDGDNDVLMLRWAGQLGDSVAMGDAPAHVKEAANRTTGSIHENGLLTALQDKFPHLLG